MYQKAEISHKRAELNNSYDTNVSRPTFRIHAKIIHAVAGHIGDPE